MICLVSREERQDSRTVNKITKLGATMMTRDLFGYADIAKQTYDVVDSWKKARNNPDKNLIERRGRISTAIKLSYIVMRVHDNFPEHYVPLYEHLCGVLDKLEIKPREQAA